MNQRIRQLGVFKLLGKQCWRGICQRRVGSVFIVILPPVFNLLAGIFKRHEPVDVQAFIPKAAIEGFDEWVKALNLLPLNNASETKSMLQSWLGAFNSGRSSRVAAVRCRRGRLVHKFNPP